MHFKIVFEREAWNELVGFETSDRKLFDTIWDIIELMELGLIQGKPLRGEWRGYFSIRFRDKYRILYTYEQHPDGTWMVIARIEKRDSSYKIR